MLGAMIAAGFAVRGFDIRPRGDFGDFAAHVTDDAREFARNLRILFTVVRDADQTERLLFTDQHLLEQARKLEMIVICSTLSPRYLNDLRKRIDSRIAMIDAPMSGARIAAQERRLSFMLGGDREILARLQPLFDAMGQSFHHMGGFGMGMQAKVLNNIIAASSTVITRLALDWAGQAGLDEAAFLRLVDASSGQNWFASHFDEIEFSRDGYEPENTIGILKKDVESALDAAPDGADTRLPELLAELIAQMRSKP